MNQPITVQPNDVITFSKAGPICGIVGSLILFGIAGFFASIVADSPIDEWPPLAYYFVFAPGAAGLWIFLTRFARLVDASPQMIFKPEGIVFCQNDPRTTIRWDHILRTRVSQTYKNHCEESSYLTVVYLNERGTYDEVTSRIDRLTRSSGSILSTIKKNANLEDAA